MQEKLEEEEEDKRQITRFVDFNIAFKHPNKFMPAVVDEVPIHVLDYMNIKGTTPEKLRAL